MHIRINSLITEDFDVITEKYGKKATGVVRRVRKLGLPDKEYFEVVMDKDKGRKIPCPTCCIDMSLILLAELIIRRDKGDTR